MLQQSILWGFWVSRLQYILCVMKWPLLFHINKTVGSNLSSPVGRGRGCCSLLKHICTVGPRSGFSSREEPAATKQFLLCHLCGRRGQPTAAEGKAEAWGCRNIISVYPHSAFLVLLPAVSPVQGDGCQGSSWGRESHLSWCCSEALGQCGNSAAKQPPCSLVAEVPRLQPFMYFMEDLLVGKEPCSQGHHQHFWSGLCECPQHCH